VTTSKSVLQRLKPDGFHCVDAVAKATSYKDSRATSTTPRYSWLLPNRNQSHDLQKILELPHRLLSSAEMQGALEDKFELHVLR
jgi:hypothetical protein